MPAMMVQTDLGHLYGARGVDTFTIDSSIYAIVASQQSDGVQMIKLVTTGEGRCCR